MSVRPQLLHELLDQSAQKNPHNPALTSNARTLTYVELADASRRTALLLHRVGVNRGDRIVVSSTDGLAVTLLVYATSRLGAVFSVIHEQVRGAPLEHVLNDCEPTLFISEDDDTASTSAQHSVAVLPVAEVLAAALDTDTAAASADVHRSETLEVDPICLIYTSGTTALPKAVVSTHQQVLCAAAAIHACLNYLPSDVIYCPLPLSFDYGLYQIFLATLSGSHLRLGTVAEAGPPLLRHLEDSGATVLPAVPSVADRLAWLLRRSNGKLGKLRLITNTGSALSDSTMSALRHAIPGLKIQVMYGLTECKRAAIMPPDGDRDRPGSCGRPLPGTEIFVIDDQGTRVRAGEIGQLVVRGPHVMAGYWRRPELTAERFHRQEGLFAELRTGDYGWLDDDGFLYFSGRKDDLYKERGFRLSTTEVEAAAHRVDGVASAAVIPPTGRRSALLAVVADITVEEVLEQMRQQIEPFKIPRRCLRLDALPTNGNGKIDRKRLATLVEAGNPAVTTEREE